MICKVRHTIEKYGMIKDGDRVVVALSGGADSMCLLHILLSLKDEIGFTLSAAHVNHGIRGSEAERDQDFVNNYCDKNKIDLYICRLDVPSVSSQTGEGLEECGRRLRYDYLYNISDGALIATAHNLNDRIETFIFNFTRGSGLNGLCSIPPVRDKIIRPLIDCSREEIEDYCRTNSIPYVTDSTNSDVNYSRNRIRQNVIPELKAINQSFEKSALRCFDTVISDNEYISSVADSVYSKCFNNGGYSTALLINTHPSIRNRVISRIIYEKTGINPDKKTIDKTCELIKSEGKSEIQNGTVIRVNDGLLDFPDVFTFYEWKNDCKTGVNILPEAIVEVLSLNKNSTDIKQIYNSNDLKYIIDKEKIKGNIVFRSRNDGDAFRPLGRNCNKSLKKLFNENKIPVENRNRIIVCSDEEGIIFVEGFGIDERYAVTDASEEMLCFIVRRNCDAK